jgi:esterase/lipase superfamily enzyme
MMAILLFGLAAWGGGGAAGGRRPPELIGIDNPAAPAQSVRGVDRHRIFIMSTRQASEVAGAFFSGERAPELGLASVDVTIPPNHVVGRLERPRRLPPNPLTEFAVVNPVVYRNDPAFIAEVNRALAARPPARRELLLFVHGYNNTTSDAILRLAQFVRDTGFQGVPVLFTWASAAKTPRYVYDLNSALVARVKVKEMAEILSRTNARSVNIFAHSMGTFLTMEGLVDAQLAGRLNRGGRIANIMLASPDIDIDLFRTQISLLPKPIIDKMYLLISKDDSALRVSRRIAGGVPRVGAADAADLEKLGVTVIDLSAIEDSSSGSHSKFAGSPEVVQLIGSGLNSAGGLKVGGTPELDQLLSGVPIRILGN